MRSVIDRLAEAASLHRNGELEPACCLYTSVLADDPDNPSALYLGGLLDLQAGRVPQAARRLAKAVVKRPDHVGSLVALAAAQLKIGEPDSALVAADSALRLAPSHPRACFVRGTALGQLGDHEAAAAALQTAVEGDPDHADSWLNLGNCLLELDDLSGAEQHCRAAIAHSPRLAEAYASLGHILCSQQRYDEAIAACAEATRLRPNFAEAHWNQGIACLLAGDFASGWEKYEWRKRHRTYGRDFHPPSPREWLGGPVNGRVVLVTAEQGLGDAIQFARYIPMLRNRGAEVILSCAEPLVPLLASLAPCVDRSAPPPAHDVWVDQMSLPRRFDTTLDTIPSPAGYLSADPGRTAAWRRRLPQGQLIGLVWAGNPAHSNDRRRSLPADALRQWRAPAGSRFVGLQLGPRAGEGAEIPGLLDVSAGLIDFAETAAALSCLDLLISVDTSVAHLAGALGLRAWMLLPYAPDWRWLPGAAQPREDSPWYASLRLFRQSRPGDWSDPLKRVADGLAGNRLADGSGGQSPASTGRSPG